MNKVRNSSHAPNLSVKWDTLYGFKLRQPSFVAGDPLISHGADPLAHQGWPGRREVLIPVLSGSMMQAPELCRGLLGGRGPNEKRICSDRRRRFGRGIYR